MENSYIVLGNGFSIDLVQKMEKAEEIDLANLFSKGEHVLYPKTNTRGFLSRKYTPDLWNLGARTYMSYEAATQLVTDVITCANVYNLSVEKRPNEERDSSIVQCLRPVRNDHGFVALLYGSGHQSCLLLPRHGRTTVMKYVRNRCRR